MGTRPHRWGYDWRRCANTLAALRSCSACKSICEYPYLPPFAHHLIFSPRQTIHGPISWKSKRRMSVHRRSRSYPFLERSLPHIAHRSLAPLDTFARMHNTIFDDTYATPPYRTPQNDLFGSVIFRLCFTTCFDAVELDDDYPGKVGRSNVVIHIHCMCILSLYLTFYPVLYYSDCTLNSRMYRPRPLVS